MFKGIEHVGLLSRDAAGLAEWYERVLGFRRVYQTDAVPPGFFLSAGGVILEIVPNQEVAETRPTPVPTHLAIEVDDFEAAVQHLREHGIQMEEPFDIFHGGKVVFFHDPVGNRLHLMYRPVTPWE